MRFDNRDVGRSSRITSAADPAYTLSDMAADAVAVLDAVGWGSAMVFGQSMGGMIAQQVAIEHPGRTDAVVSCMSATGEPGYTTRNDKVIQGLLAVPPTDREGWLAHPRRDRSVVGVAHGVGCGLGSGPKATPFSPTG